MKKADVRCFFKRITEKPTLCDFEIAEILGTKKSNFSKFPENLGKEQRKWVLDWLWKQRMPVPPELEKQKGE